MKSYSLRDFQFQFEVIENFRSYIGIMKGTVNVWIITELIIKG